MHSQDLCAVIRRLSAHLLVIVVLVAAGPVAARAPDMVDVYEITPSSALDILKKQAKLSFATYNVTPIPGGISVHTLVILDAWDTDVYVQEVEFELMPGTVIHGVTVATHSGGTSFLTGRLIHDNFLGKFRRKLENASKKYVVAESRVRDIDAGGGGEGGSTGASKGVVYVGTGFVVLNGGYIVTANHVVENGKTISALCGTEAVRPALVVSRDPANDIALLKVETPLRYHLTIADEGSVHTGDKVFTIGFPLPELLGAEGKYSEGVISSLSGYQGAANLMQMTTPIQPGNSGGALVDTNGHVIGIVTSTAAARVFYENSGNIPQNINWAVKSDYLRPLLVPYLPSATPNPVDKEKLSPIEQTGRATCFLKVTT